MGWFWADDPRPSAPPIAVETSASPPPGCPMRKNSTTLQSCPYIPSDKTSQRLRIPPKNSTLAKLNPLNYMPSHISQERAPNQTVTLPVCRESSTIPKGDGSGNWEYPSPQQMYNAMLRKGYTDTPQDAVESMVAVHNFLNEGAWAEIMEWERRFNGGLANGWKECQRGEDGGLIAAAQQEQDRRLGLEREDDDRQPKLVRFIGRPQDMTPKAKIMQALGWIYPQKFSSEPPFDRHDWYVQRQGPDGRTRDVRYVIDYYSGPPEPTGEPVFYLDVRPAVDGPSAAVERIMRWGGDVWWRASGGSVRDERA